MKRRTRQQKRLLRWAAFPAAIILLAIGTVTLPLPLPTGIILIALGLAVAAFNPRLLRAIRRMRGRFPEANMKLRHITSRLPPPLRRILNRTDYQR